VMPFSRSRSIVSSTRSATSWFSRNAPDSQSRASTSVVLPWSTCATMATLRISERSGTYRGYRWRCAPRCSIEPGVRCTLATGQLPVGILRRSMKRQLTREQREARLMARRGIAPPSRRRALRWCRRRHRRSPFARQRWTRLPRRGLDVVSAAPARARSATAAVTLVPAATSTSKAPSASGWPRPCRACSRRSPEPAPTSRW
jgi:hypothetical protein